MKLSTDALWEWANNGLSPHHFANRFFGDGFKMVAASDAERKQKSTMLREDRRISRVQNGGVVQ